MLFFDEEKLLLLLGYHHLVLKILFGKTIEALSAISGSVVGAVFAFLSKAFGFVAEHTMALTVFAAGLHGVWLMQNDKK